MKRRVDGASPSRVAKFHALVVQRRDNRLRSGPVRVRVLPGAPLHAPVAKCIERRASNAEVEGGNPSGSAISSRNVNRTSEPGLGANEIVPPPRGMRSMSSAFRHFSQAHECKRVEQQVLQICASGCESRRGCQFYNAHVVQSAETRRRERRQCGCNSRCEHHFRSKA